MLATKKVSPTAATSGNIPAMMLIGVRSSSVPSASIRTAKIWLFSALPGPCHTIMYSEPFQATDGWVAGPLAKNMGGPMRFPEASSLWANTLGVQGCLAMKDGEEPVPVRGHGRGAV